MSITGLSGANIDVKSLDLTSKAGENIQSKINIEELTPEEYIRNYFSDEPVMIEVAKCESRFRQENKDGEVLRGEINSSDKGVMQINEYYHGKRADSLGLDLHSLEDNAKYARFLFEKEGLQPWISSSKCWKKTAAYADYIQKRELARK